MNNLKYFKKEIDYIKDENLKKDLEVLISKLPDYFFEIPASSTGKYHPKYSNGKMGLLKHTKAATTIAYTLLKNDTIGKKFNNKEKDLIIMALILHDGFKLGKEKSKYSVFEHPLVVSEMIMNNKDQLQMSITDVRKLCKMIESHMGQWDTNPYTKKQTLPQPVTECERFVHMCDFLSSKKFINIEFTGYEVSNI
ncbi:MAG: HD domain-containing protein [bacterium]|nr:HD domain-containing protein [bacterium]